MQQGNLKQEARGQWDYLLPALGISDEFLSNNHGPCPACGGVDRFRYDDKDGYGSFYCNHCGGPGQNGGAGDGITLVMKVFGWSFHETAKEIRNLIGGGAANDVVRAKPQPKPGKTEADITADLNRKKSQLRALWKSSRPVQKGDLVAKYFESRGIFLKEYPVDLRTHMRLKYYELVKKEGEKKSEFQQLGTYPGLLALCRSPNGQATTLWRTYLNSEGNGKANVRQQKKPYSQPGAGAAVRLFEPVDGVLGVAEGIETALAAHILYKIPVWAGMCADIMKGIVFPDTVKEVVIFADNDAPDSKGFCKGIEAAKELALRLRGEGRKVSIKMPKEIGTDYLDVLNAFQKRQ